jgi:hypothetical protein
MSVCKVVYTANFELEAGRSGQVYDDRPNVSVMWTGSIGSVRGARFASVTMRLDLLALLIETLSILQIDCRS